MPATRYRRGLCYAADMAAYARIISEDNAKDLGRLQRNLARALQEELTLRQQQALTLYYLQGYTMREIGEQLGVDRSTISRTIRRGEARLRRCLRYGAASLLCEEH